MYFRSPVVEEIHSTAGHRQQRNGDEPPESRTHRRSDSHLRFHPVADPAGGTAVRDKSLGRVPHSSATINGHTQIPQHIWAEGLDFTLETWITVDRLLIFSIRTDRIVRDGWRANHDIHSLFTVSTCCRQSGSLPHPFADWYQLQGQAHEA